MGWNCGGWVFKGFPEALPNPLWIRMPAGRYTQSQVLNAIRYNKKCDAREQR